MHLCNNPQVYGGIRGVCLQDSGTVGWLARNILPHEPGLRRWLARQLPGDLLLDDVVQETYARLAQVKNCDSIDNPRAYFFQTARSIVLMHFRRARIVQFEALSEMREVAVDTSPQVDDVVLWREQLQLFRGHLAAMPHKARAAFELRFWKNLSYAQVGELLGMSENAAQKNVTRNLQILARRMAEGGFGAYEASIIKPSLKDPRNAQEDPRNERSGK